MLTILKTLGIIMALENTVNVNVCSFNGDIAVSRIKNNMTGRLEIIDIVGDIAVCNDVAVAVECGTADNNISGCSQCTVNYVFIFDLDNILITCFAVLCHFEDSCIPVGHFFFFNMLVTLVDVDFPTVSTYKVNSVNITVEVKFRSVAYEAASGIYIAVKCALPAI